MFQDFADQIPQVPPPDAFSKSPPEAENGNRKGSLPLINPAELLGDEFSQGIDWFASLPNQAGMSLGHRVQHRPSVNGGRARIDEAFDSFGGSLFQEV